MRGFLIIACLFIASSCFGQESRKHHVISAEVFGLGIILSGNYDFAFGYSKTGFFDLRAGLGVFSVPGGSGTSIPHALTYNLGAGADHFEFGIGGTYVAGTNTGGLQSRGYALAPVMLGYRRLSKSGFHFRIYSIFFTNGKDVFVFGGLGAGKAF